MRLELAGSLIRPDPLLIKFSTNQNFIPQTYIDLGYTHFDVICIGAGGGTGGGINQGNAGTLIRSYGGAGGGGGFHRARGLLSALAATCPVTVGIGGAPGTEQVSNAALTTDGSDGGASTFNSTTCRASGGKGGKRVQSNSTTVSTQANGGQGGIGNRSIAGGGATGGVAGTPNPTTPDVSGTVGQDGTFANKIGQGGGGGAGGVGKFNDPLNYLSIATAGGRGAYNPGDLSVYGPAAQPANDPTNAGAATIPGGASGAKAAPLNGLPTVYGQSQTGVLPGLPGVVILLLTSE